MKKIRGFEVVDIKHRIHKQSAPTVDCDTKIILDDGTFFYIKEIKLPTRSDPRSAGYDFYSPAKLTILPHNKIVLFTDVKAYMQNDEILEIYIRSSLATKKGLMLSNNVGIIDSSYYNNPGNDGNIGIALVNTSGKTVEINEGERVAQGIFKKYLVADNDESSGTRSGGFGSSGK